MKKHIIKSFFLLLGLTVVLDSYAIDTSKAVGEIPIQYAQSPSGAVTYNVPIDIYPGTRGFQPNISLIYNSMAGSSILGMGWNLSASSIISVESPNLYYNEETVPYGELLPEVLFPIDPLILDGRRLIKINHKENIVLYQSEEGNIYAEFDRSNNEISVYYPNGEIATYTVLVKSEEDDNSSFIRNLSQYILYKKTNITKDVITYSYIFEKNVAYISEINYGTKIGGNYFASVKFEYENREDVSFAYDNHGLVTMDKRLKTIKSYYENNLLRTYDINYKYNNEKRSSSLIQIDCVSNGESLNPLIFNYGEEQNRLEVETEEIELENFTTPKVNEHGLNIIPFRSTQNPDKPKLLVFPKRSFFHKYDSDYNNNYNDTLYIYDDNSTGKLSAKIPLYRVIPEKNTDLRSFNLLNAGGSSSKISLVYSQPVNERGSWMDKLTFDILDEDKLMSSFNLLMPGVYEEKKAPDSKEKVRFPVGRHFLTGDFRGIGRDEILVVTRHNPKLCLSEINIVDTGSGRIIHKDSKIVVEKNDMVFAHSNPGDTRTKLWHINDYGLTIYSYSDRYGFSSIRHESRITTKNVDRYADNKWKIHPLPPKDTTHIDTGKYILFINDINNDGLLDVLLYPLKSYNEFTNKKNQILVFYSTTRSYDFTQKSYDLLFDHTELKDCVLNDINGDGFLDLVATNTNKRTIVHLNRNGKYELLPGELKTFCNVAGGENFYSENTMYLAWYRSPFYNLDIGGPIGPGEVITSNGISNCATIKHKKIYTTRVKNPISQQLLLTKATNSLGIKQEHSYSSLLNKNIHQVSIVPDSHQKRYSRLAVDMNLVDKTISYIGDNREAENLISSQSYKYANATFDKFKRVFAGFEKLIVTDNLRNKITSVTYDPYTFGVVKEEETPTSHIRYSYRCIINENKIAQVLLQAKKVSDKINNINSMSLYQYDAYGNAVKEFSTFGDGISTEITRSYINTSIENLPEEPYIVGALTQEEITNKRGSDIVTNKAIINYDSRYMPTSSFSYINGQIVSSKWTIYDSNYNIEKTQSRFYSDIPLFVEEYEYDNWGRLKKQVDPLKFSTEFEYNSKGQLINKYEQLGNNRSTYLYDNWGNIKQTTLTNDAGTFVKAINRKWDTSIDGSVVSETVTATGQPSSVMYRDIHGREIRSGQQRFDGIKTIKIQDVTGQVTHVVDPAGMVAYKYRADNKLLSITAPGDIVTSFEYDMYGRQTAIIDPSAGRKTYSYDKAGNISQETDANGKAIKYEYDKYGKITKKDIVGEFTTTYQYNTFHLLTQEATSNGLTKTYTYDSTNRLKTSVEETSEGIIFDLHYTYNTDGTIGMIDYRSHNKQIGKSLSFPEFLEYANGHLVSRRHEEEEKPYWKLISENDLGLTSSAETGPLKRTYSFDKYGLPTNRQTGVNNGMVVRVFQQSFYKFDPLTNNLLSRTNDLANWLNRQTIETFQYDELNRLTGILVNNKETSTKNEYIYGYDVRGNILNNSSVGSYQYKSTDPYAVMAVTPYGDAIALRRQDVSYSSLMRPLTIKENGNIANFKYDANGDRFKMTVDDYDDGAEYLKKYYLGGGTYELILKDGASYENGVQLFYLGGDAYSAPAVLVKDKDGWRINYILRDYQGNITHITDSEGNVIQELSYDAWGRLRNPKTFEFYADGEEPELLLGRGYTGHEHLQMFALINMNARLYDPALGRFLSPDPYVQSPFDTQRFNRYSYGLNNPLKYTDPDGEIPVVAVAAIVFAASFSIDYLYTGLTTESWGMKSVGNSLVSAGISTAGFFATGGAAGGLSKAWTFIGQNAINTVVSHYMPPVAIPIGNFTVSMSPASGFGASGLTAGENLSVNYTNGDFSIGASVGAGTGYKGWSARTAINGWGGGFGQTSYEASEVMGQQFGAQKVGSLTGYFNYNSFTFSNDILGDGEDRWRTNAVELNIGKWSIGTYLYTNYGKEDGQGVDYDAEAPYLGKNKYKKGAWNNGQSYFAPLWVGYKRGNEITRFGFSHPLVQNFTQNVAHRTKLGSQNYYLNYDNFKTGGYFYSGNYNPLSLWDR